MEKRKNENLLQAALFLATVLLVCISILSVASASKNIPSKNYVLHETKKLTNSNMVQEEKKQVIVKNYPEPDYEIPKYGAPGSIDGILQRPRNFQTPGYPFNGNTEFLRLDDSVAYNHKYNKYDYVQEIKFGPIPTNTILKTHIVAISLNSIDLFNNASFEFPIHNIVLVAEDGQTVLPYWIQDDYQKEILIWTRIPKTVPNKRQKSLYIAVNKDLKFPGIEGKYAFSNFNSVFYQDTDGLTGNYSFVLKSGGTYKEIFDHSGLGNNGSISKLEFAKTHSFGSWYGYGDIFFGAWNRKNPTFFRLPINNKSNQITSRKGTIEMWLHHQNDCLDANDSPSKEKRKIVFFSSENGNMEFFYHDDAFYFIPNKQDEQAILRIPWKPDYYYKIDIEFPITLSWDFKNKSAEFSIYCEKQTLDLTPLKKYWKSPAEFTEMHFGSTNEASSHSFAGQITGLYLYNKSLENYSDYLYQAHNHENIHFKAELYSSVTLDKEELLFTPLLLDYSDCMYYTKNYAAIFSSSYFYSDCFHYGLTNKENNCVFVLSKEYDGKRAIFGVPGHYHSYIGTPVQVKKPCFVEYIGLKVNNPELVKNWEISFKYLRSRDDLFDTSQNTTTGSSFAEKCKNALVGCIKNLIPNAYACCPFWTYELYGKSNTNRVDQENKNDDIIWLKLYDPIYVDQEANMMQIEYELAKKSGYLDVQLVDVVVRGMDGKLSKAVLDLQRKYFTYRYFKTEWNSETGRYEFSDKDIVIPESYKAIIAEEEKGRIRIDVSEDKKSIVLELHNAGNSTIVLDDKSFNFMITQSYIHTWDGLSCFLEGELEKNKKRREFYIPIKNKLSRLRGEIIRPNESIEIPLITVKDIKTKLKIKNESKNFVVKLIEAEDRKEYNNNLDLSNLPNRIIFWYFYAGKYSGDYLLRFSYNTGENDTFTRIKN